ncbi:MAG: DNA polymerase I [Candidatus Ordinivivax streblomastigis]|uniref:DNA polymerase I n=1 Tax=Candidatus Ordinivivax streblomastigis TaxID=2540710 RepID=A0A5M8P1Q6_9BACT|nr:MAG: DNA polymerase I [Candidatus Ordinivivax streblomastigis]
MKLFLLDAYALIYRAYYAMIKMPRINSKGFNTSAVFGFVNTLEEVLKKENPSHIGVAFDPAGPTFRHEAFVQYKAQREETPEVIRLSVPVIKDIIRAYNIPILEVPHYEADDVIGTLAKKAPKDYDVFMMTPDKDYCQLVEENVFVYKPQYGSSDFDILGVEEVKKKYGLDHPLQIIDFLGLMGDAADNIPGCPGVGEVTAKKLIAEFGSIENLLENTEKIKGTLKSKVEENREMIVFSKFLATIKTDVPIDFNPDELVRQELNEPKLRQIFDELEFRQLTSRVFRETKMTVPVAKQQNRQPSLFDELEETDSDEVLYSGFNRLKDIPHNYQLVDTDEKMIALVERIRTQKDFVFDTETTGLDPFAAELVGISFALKEGEAFYCPFPAQREEIKKKVQVFKGILEDKHILKIGQNLKYDINVLKKYDIRVDGPMFDTMIAHYLLNPESRHNMDYLSEVYLKYQTIHIEELIGGKGKNQLTMRQVPLDLLVDYACEDADVTLRLKNQLEELVKKEDFSHLFYQIEMPLVPVLADMEEAGVRVEITALKDSSVVLTQYLGEIEKEVFQLAGNEFNISSPKMVGDVLFNQLKIVENSRKTKSGQYTTSEDVLESLKSKHPIVEKILEFRKIKKLLSTYMDALPTLISPIDGKIHTTYNQASTATGRLSSTNPNLQNIPIRDEEGKEIRRAFIPDKNNLFLSVDYSQIELRIMAHLSRDKNMVEAFQSGQDIHAATAAKIYGIPLSEVTKEMRRKAKTANFGIIYGISTFGLAEQLRIPRAEAKELIDGYFATFPDVKAYMEQSIAVARENKQVETIFHRKRFLPDIDSRNAIVRGYAERNAINAPIQGSAADIIKVAMVRIHQRFAEEKLRSRMIMQVHDELNFNVLPDELDQLKQIVVEEMEHAIELRVPLIAECGVGQNWLEAH